MIFKLIVINFANIYKPNKKEKYEVRGRNLLTGLPATIEINQEETKEALQDNIKKIIKATKQVLEQTSPELSADIVDKGVIITGGGSMLNGLSEVLEEEFIAKSKFQKNFMKEIRSFSRKL